MSPERVERFWSKVRRLPTGCWEWQACTNDAGYGIFGVGGKRIDRAHRIAYRLAKGRIPPGRFVLHACDNRRCVNPEHLSVGTNLDNVRDMILKGRNSPPPPMAGWNEIELPPEASSYFGRLPDTEIGDMFGVAKHVIRRKRAKLGIAACPSQTKFREGMPHPRWSRRKGEKCQRT